MHAICNIAEVDIPHFNEVLYFIFIINRMAFIGNWQTLKGFNNRSNKEENQGVTTIKPYMHRGGDG